MRLKTARELGMRLKEAGEELGLTQIDLAERIGAPRRWVWEMEKGKEVRNGTFAQPSCLLARMHAFC